MIRWITGFLDLPMSTFLAAAGFWCSTTGYRLSAARGGHDQFATLLPPDADPCWRVQGVDNGAGGAHLDLHVDEVPADSAQTVLLGAAVVFEEDGLTVLRSPAGSVATRGVGSCPVRTAEHWGDIGRPGRTRVLFDRPRSWRRPPLRFL